MAKQNKLIAYASDFVSFLIENDVKLERAILFGSVVTNEFDNESDVDIFIESKENEDNIKKLKNQFDNTRGENWRFKGVINQLAIKIGQIEKWPKLRRSMQSSGIVLYGNFKEIPKEAENYILFLLDFSSLKRIQKVNLWRKIYGYTQKIKKKKYLRKGLIEELSGRRIEGSTILIPVSKSNEFRDFLNKNKIKYKLIEVWTDSLGNLS